MSAYSIAKQSIEQALKEAAAAGVDQETVLRAVLGTLVERYRELKGVDDLKSVLQYQLDNCRGDEDFEFMRP
ncbi:MAG: hypothetical protein R3E86_15450 [Pseudomonadales bacterium]